MNQTSLKKLFAWPSVSYISRIPFTTYPGSMDCLRNLSELICDSNVNSEFFNQLSQICHNIQSLDISFKRVNSRGLAKLISVQQNLRDLSISNYYRENLTEIFISSLTKTYNTLVKLYIDLGEFVMPLSFIAEFTNLHELVLPFNDNTEYFKSLQHVILPRLQILKFPEVCPNHEHLTRFLENNGKNLKELHINTNNNSLNLAIAKSCPNLKSLYTIFGDNEIETLKVILNGCEQLESIKVWCGTGYLNEVELLKVIAKCSPKKFYKLRIIYIRLSLIDSELFSEELEPIFISWANRIPQKPLSLIVINGGANILKFKKESMKVIEKFKKLGVIKKFKKLMND